MFNAIIFTLLKLNENYIIKITRLSVRSAFFQFGLVSSRHLGFGLLSFGKNAFCLSAHGRIILSSSASFISFPYSCHFHNELIWSPLSSPAKLSCLFLHNSKTAQDGIKTFTHKFHLFRLCSTADESPKLITYLLFS